MKDSSINERLVRFLDSKKIRQVDLLTAGYTSKQTINNVWHGRRKPSCEFLERLVKDYPDLNARWLFTGEGKMILSSPVK